MTSAPPAVLPSLRAGVAVIPMADGVQLRLGDEEVHVLRTAAPESVRALLLALDGRRPRADVIAAMGAGAAHLLDDVLAELSAAGLLSSAPGDLQGIDRYLAHAAPDAADPAAALRGARVSVIGHGQSADLMSRILREHDLLTDMLPASGAAGVAASLSALPAAGALACVWEAPDLSLCLEVNRAACERRVPCLFVDLSHGRHATIGPFFVPGEGACLACLRARLRETTAAFAELDAAERIMRETGQPLPAFGCLPAHRHLVCGLSAGEIVAFFTRHRPLRTLSRAITVALEQAETWSEPVHRVPWCEACR